MSNSSNSERSRKRRNRSDGRFVGPNPVKIIRAGTKPASDKIELPTKEPPQASADSLDAELGNDARQHEV